ncbi:proteasome subunit beta type-7-like [Callorhinchus milii]|uniref:proteasome subunit beta type-7-like n=1 Tax=Callorhinchus milii TaxID=7868 RepID=UPI001C3F83D5|nr:proteasome subunit beta type-7-like [Callorhinchus milii]
MFTAAVEATGGGFQFENCSRNRSFDSFSEQKLVLPNATKTGTTIGGLVFKDGVVLGADTRATSGEVVVDKNCSKIHRISSNIYCCGAGTAADTEKTTEMLASKIELHALATGRQPRLVMASRFLQDTLFRYRGHISAMLLLGGVDCSGPHIYEVDPYGSVQKLPFSSMGSGNLAAMGVFEDRYRPDMNEEEAKMLVRDAINAGIMNDLGSGSNIDLCVITQHKVDFIRPYNISNYKGQRLGRYRYPRGCTAVLSKDVTPLSFQLIHEEVQEMQIS